MVGLVSGGATPLSVWNQAVLKSADAEFGNEVDLDSNGNVFTANRIQVLGNIEPALIKLAP